MKLSEQIENILYADISQLTPFVGVAVDEVDENCYTATIELFYQNEIQRFCSVIKIVENLEDEVHLHSTSIKELMCRHIDCLKDVN